jgi:23S rRNA (cytidine1920-2'-O)/16S rRNA (cytidine1409-2'-O)-methyltransferase
VVVLEGTNARHLQHLPEPVSLVTIDASFISLKLLLPIVRGWLSSSGEVIALIKPQFETGREQAARTKGVIRDPEIHRIVLSEVLAFAQQDGFQVVAVLRSPLIGPKGNTEFLAYLKYPAQATQDVNQLVAGLIEPSGGYA